MDQHLALLIVHVRTISDKGDKMDVYDIPVKGPNEGVLDQVVENGQKVRIVRMVTYSYIADMEDVYDVLGETDITVRSLIKLEEDENGMRYNPDILRTSVIEDDIVIAVQTL